MGSVSLSKAGKTTAGGVAGKPQSLDIYCRRQRRWRMECQFPPDRMDAAVAEAQRLDRQPGVEGVRIMMPTLGTSTRKPIELMVWVSPRLEDDLFKSGVKLKRHGAASEPEPEAPTGSLSDSMVAPPPPLAEETPAAQSPAAPRPFKVFLKLVGVAGASVAIALLFTLAATAAMPHLGSVGLVLTATARGNLLNGGFIVSLLVTMAILGPRYIRPEEIGLPAFRSRDSKQRNPAASPPSESPPQTSASGIVPDVAPTIHDFLEEARQEGALAAPPPEPSVLIQDVGSPPLVADPPPPPPESVLPPPLAPAPIPILDPAFQTLEIPEAEASPAAPKPKKSGREHKLMLVSFLQDTIIAVKDRIRKLDAHTAFGLHLFLGGACDHYVQAKSLPDKQRLELTLLAVAALGAKPERAQAFLANFGDYGNDSKYRTMIKCGRSVMARKLAGEVEPFQELAIALEAWSGSQAGEAAAQGVLTIMFTDIVGSTKMTRERGDFGAQEAVRAHNAVVRNALAYHGGREVKHTGDGIMATFSNPAAAVQAAGMIQRDLARRNATPGQAPVAVRIGLNAGDVVREENDIYGAAVQLSARTCDKAGAGQVFVTEAVKDLTRGHDIAYAEAGRFAMKGIDGEVLLFSVTWE
ncbi:MAG: adenylate/guanylate cyclase domain-containing protein [Magnetospirillum sp. WYHS-4]